MPILSIRLINVGVRGAVLLSRFFFLFALAKMMPPSEVGKYGLLVAAVGYSIYFVGLDFYTYTTRQISGGERSEWGLYIKSQATLSGGLYLFFFPLFIIIFSAQLLPWELAGWFFVILFLEHMCLEFIRFFIAAAEQLSASIVLFFNQALWAVGVILIMIVDERFRSLGWVFSFWIGGSLVALCYSFLKIKKMHLGGWARKVDVKWLWRGVKIALPLLLATLAFRGIFTFDRYLASALLNLEFVAVYVLFIGVAGSLLAFLDAAVFSFAYPSLIESFKKQQPASFKYNMRVMLISVVFFSTVFIFFSLWALPYLLVWIGKEIYLESYHVFYWVLSAIVINALWMIFHYALYSQQLDRYIVSSHLAGFLVFLVFSGLLYLMYPQQSILIGLCLSQFIILIWKFLAYARKTPKAYLGFGR